MDSFPEIEGVIKTEVDSFPTPEGTGEPDSIDITYIIPDIKPVIPPEKRGFKRSKEDSEPEPVASKSLKKKKPAGREECEDGEDGARREKVVKKEPPDYSANCDYGETSIWVDDIDESDEYVIPDLPSEFNLGPEAEKRLKELTTSVKKKVRVENQKGGAEAVDVPVSSGDGDNWDGITTDCSWDCIHAKQNELLKEAVHQLSRRNTLLEDFIQVEFDEKFQKFLKKRKLLLSTGYGETRKETSGKRSGKSDEVVDLLRLMKESEKSNSKREENGRHRHRSKTETRTASSHRTRRNENVLSPTSSSVSDQARKKKTVHFKGAIYPQHKVADIGKDVADPLKISSIAIRAPSKPPVPPISTIRSILTKRSLPESSVEDESSDEEDINGLALPQLLKWQDLKKQCNLAICPVCNEALKMTNMRDHLIIIHKSIKLTCVAENCLMEFKTRHLLKKHLLEKHSWSEEVYLEVIKTLEEPVLQWLDEMSSKIVSITIDNVIRRKKLQAYMEEAKKRTEERIETLVSKSVSEAKPIPIPPITFKPPIVKEVSAPAMKPVNHRAPTKAIRKLLKSGMPIKPPLNEEVEDEKSDEDDDTTGLTLSQLLKWQDTGISRKLSVCQICNVTLKLKNLRDHLLVVHKNIKLTCPVYSCRLEFKTRSFLKKHLFQKHFIPNIQEAYSELIKTIENPVLEWLNQKCDKYQITTMTNAIKRTRKQLTKEEEKGKKSNPKEAIQVLAPPPRPAPIFFPKSPPHPPEPQFLPRFYQECPP